MPAVFRPNEDDALLQLSADRLSRFSSDKVIPSEEIDREFGWTDSALSAEEDVELE